MFYTVNLLKKIRLLHMKLFGCVCFQSVNDNRLEIFTYDEQVSVPNGIRIMLIFHMKA